MVALDLHWHTRVPSECKCNLQKWSGSTSAALRNRIEWGSVSKASSVSKLHIIYAGEPHVEQHDAILIFRLTHDDTPQDLHSFFTKKQELALRQTRNLILYYFKPPHLSITQWTHITWAPSTWNSLPGDIRQAGSLNMFKFHFKKYIFCSANGVQRVAKYCLPCSCTPLLHYLTLQAVRLITRLTPDCPNAHTHYSLLTYQTKQHHLWSMSHSIHHNNSYVIMV